MQLAMFAAATSDWLDPLLRHAMIAHSIDNPSETPKRFKNWASPNFIQPSTEKPKIRLDPDEEKVSASES